TGKLRPGFPVQVNRAFSEVPGCQTTPLIVPNCDQFVAHPVRDHVNTVDHAFTSNPSAGDIDPSYPGMELVAGANDGHLYAWHADGTPVPGWPVLLRDPAKVAAVDPVSHLITFKPGANAKYGRQEIVTPTVADLDGDGAPEVVTASIASPPYVLTPKGKSKFGNGPDGKYVTTASEQTEFKSPTATDGPSVGSLGGAVVGHLGGSGSPASIAMG